MWNVCRSSRLEARGRTGAPSAGAARASLLLAWLSLLGAGGLVAQSADPMPLTRLTGPVVMDGIPNEPAWEDVKPLPLTAYSPTFQGPLTERTDILVAYDDEYLYLAGRMYDSDTKGIRANTLYRDRYSGDDLIAIVLDTYNDHETAVWFSTTPSGARSDRAVANDAEFSSGADFSSGTTMNSNWNTFWDVATALGPEGWFAELRVPFSSLGFQDDNGHVEMGMIVYRFIARKNERQLFPAIPPNWGMGFAKPSQAQRVTLEGVYSRKPVYVTPYLLGGVSRAAIEDTLVAAYRFDNDRTNEAGIDVRYSPSSNLNIDVTVNTDFAQVEADDQQVNLTRFSLFFPEKRQFFQERSSTFAFNTGGQSRLFHSRRIGLSEGEPIRILGGARMVGRAGSMDFGLLNMQTAASDGLPSENFGVLRLRRQVINSFSNIGAIATTRVGDDGSYNVAVGADGIVRPFGDEYITIKLAQTFDKNESGGVNLVDRSRVLARWERRNEIGFSYATEYVRSGRAYDPGLGFSLREDFSFLLNEIQYQWFFGATSPFRSLAIANSGSGYLRNADRTVESGSIEPTVEIEFKNGAELEISSVNSYESVRDSFEISGGAPIVPGDYWFHEGQVRFMASRAARIRPSVTVSAGSFYDGWRVGFETGPTWNVSRHLELGGEYILNLIRFSDRDLDLDAHLLRLRVQAALDIHFSVTAFVQYNSTRDLASVNARLRYHFREGHDLWLVFDDALNIDRDPLAIPRLPRSQNRALLLKYTYTFVR